MSMEVGSVEPWAVSYLQAVLNDDGFQEALCRYIPTDVGSKCVPAGTFERAVSRLQEHTTSDPPTPPSGGGRGPAHPPDEDRFSAKASKIRLPALKALSTYAKDHVVLRGRPGSGKTTLLRRFLLDEAERILREESGGGKGEASSPSRIPVFVELKFLKDDPVDLIARMLDKHDASLTRPEIETGLRSGRFFLLLDGLNEVPSGPEGEESLEDLRDRFGARTPMVFSSRDLLSSSALKFRERLELEPLTKDQIKRFVETYLPEEQAPAMLRALDPRMDELAETPLFLMMMCALFASRKKLPSSMGEVLKAWIEGIYWDFKCEGMPRVVAERDNWDLLVQRLAVEMNLKGAPVLTSDEWKPVAEACLKELSRNAGPGDVVQWLNDVAAHHIVQVGRAFSFCLNRISAGNRLLRADGNSHYSSSCH